MSEIDAEREQYIKDSRIPCKYGLKCFQKNPVHHEKYKHPPKRKNGQARDSPAKRIKLDVDSNKDSTSEGSSKTSNEPKTPKLDEAEKKENASDNTTISPSVEDKPTPKKTQTNSAVPYNPPPVNFNVKKFIKEKFFVSMPIDFYHFYELCETLNKNNPPETFSFIGLSLVGPYDVLAGKFYNCSKTVTDADYLVHWRYYYDPPSFQTVLSGSKNGYHVGYFWDAEKEAPAFLASNNASKDGTFNIVGDNIFAAVNHYIENECKNVDPFSKMKMLRYQSVLKNKAQELKYELGPKTDKIRARDKKVVARTFNKIGIVVPYNKRTQLGYRELQMSDKEIRALLTKIENSLPEQRDKFLAELQQLLTCTNIAIDECDFGTGLELGLDILAHGVPYLNGTISRFLFSGYHLLEMDSFGKIAEAHMANRRKGTNMSII